MFWVIRTWQQKPQQTVMLLDSAETMVIGGIAATEEQKSERRVPCLGTVPGLGEAFKARQKTDDKRELLMFITATIIDEHGNPIIKVETQE